MIVNYKPIENADIGVIETIYEDFESKIAHKSVCTCYRPIKGCKVNTVECIFYDENNKVTGKCDLSNSLMYDMYYSQRRGIPIFDNKIVIIGWPNSLICYSITSNIVIWKNKINNICGTFFYKDKLYCLWSSFVKDKLLFVSTDTGSVLKEVIKCTPKQDENQRPDFFRLDEKYLLIYILGYIYLYDMENDSLLLTSLKIEPVGDAFWLVGITTKTANERVIRFREFKIGGEINFHEYEINKTQLIYSAKNSNHPSKILSNKESLEKEYNSLFGD